MPVRKEAGGSNTQFAHRQERSIKMRKIKFAVMIFLGCLTSAAFGAKMIMSPAKMRNMATHVIVGDVVRIYHHDQTTHDKSITNYVAEIRTKDIEKGEGLQNGDLVYARYWSSRWLPTAKPVPGQLGYRRLPKEGETLRVYLARNAYDGAGYTRDGGFNVLFADGFERLGQE
jgi:hypothetical protein